MNPRFKKQIYIASNFWQSWIKKIRLLKNSNNRFHTWNENEYAEKENAQDYEIEEEEEDEGGYNME